MGRQDREQESAGIERAGVQPGQKRSAAPDERIPIGKAAVTEIAAHEHPKRVVLKFLQA